MNSFRSSVKKGPNVSVLGAGRKGPNAALSALDEEQ